jgi:hypothetical protein
MTVNKTVADERRDIALGQLSRRNAELVQRLSKGTLPKGPVLDGMQLMLEGYFQDHHITGPYEIAARYVDNFNFLPRGCHPHFDVKHCIEIPSSSQLVSLKIFLLRSNARPGSMEGLISSWGYRPAVSFELEALNRCHRTQDFGDFDIVALGSYYTDDVDHTPRVLVSSRVSRATRTNSWRKPQELFESSRYAVIEAE